LSFVVIGIDLSAIFHFNTVFVYLVCFEGTVERERGLGFAFQVFWIVVLLYNVSTTYITGYKL
jgi:hypothetical protein